MLGNIKGNAFKWSFTSGVVNVTPGASNAEGSYTEIISDVDVTTDVWCFEIYISAGASSNNIKNHLLDVAYDPTGGTSYTAVISNIVCGQSSARTLGGIRYRFPLKIPSGSAIAVRIQGSNATAGTVAVQIVLWGNPHRPEVTPLGQYAETVGTITNSQGVTFTPGTSAFGAYQSLGTTTKDLWWWQVCAQVSDSAQAAIQDRIELSYGDGSNKHVIIPFSRWVTSSTTEDRFHPVDLLCYRFVPAGSTIYVRGFCFGTPESTHNAVAVGIGG